MKRTIALFVFITLLLSGASFANAQTNSAPEIIISWKADNSYAPPFFRGKVLPSRSSVIKARLIALENSKVIDLNQVEIRWFLNNKLISASLGLTEISITLPQFSGRYNDLTATLRQYKGSDYSKSVTIPIHPPALIVDTSALSATREQDLLTFRAYPFFFSTPKLENFLFNWKVNQASNEGLSASGAEFSVDISQLNSGDRIAIEVFAELLDNILESANYRKTFTLP